MIQEILNQVETYVRDNYRHSFKKTDTLLIKEFSNHFTVLKNQTASPLILGKDILEN